MVYSDDELTVLRQRLADATAERNGVSLMSVDLRSILIYAEEVEVMDFGEAEAFLINLRPDAVLSIVVEGFTALQRSASQLVLPARMRQRLETWAGISAPPPQQQQAARAGGLTPEDQMGAPPPTDEEVNRGGAAAAQAGYGGGPRHEGVDWAAAGPPAQALPAGVAFGSAPGGLSGGAGPPHLGLAHSMYSPAMPAIGSSRTTQGGLEETLASDAKPGGEWLHAFEFTRVKDAADRQGLSVRKLRILSFSLELGEVVSEPSILACAHGGGLGENPANSCYAKLARKNDKTLLSAIIKAKDLGKLTTHILDLSREIARRPDMMVEGQLVMTWWSEMTQLFLKPEAPKKEGLFEYLGYYFTVHRGLGLWGPVDHAILSRIVFGQQKSESSKQDTDELRKELKSVKSELGEFKAMKNELKQLKESVKSVKGPFDVTKVKCRICGETGHFASGCPNKKGDDDDSADPDKGPNKKGQLALEDKSGATPAKRG